MRIFSLLLITTLTFLSCNHSSNPTVLKEGNYRATLQLQDHQELPFTFKVIDNKHLEIYNAEETIKVDEITYKNDSVYIQTPVFEGYIVAKMQNDHSLQGSFVKPTLNRTVPFSAEFNNKTRFTTNLTPTNNINGNWETIFSPNKPEDTYIAKGIFKQNGANVKGTFRTTTGDYRYLEGIIDGDSLKLSTFDGAHAFLFTAKVTNSTMNGHFYSGNHWKEPFTAKLNNSYELPNEDSLTKLNDGYDTFNFSFPDETGKQISYTDEQFKDKVVIVQIMGSWCPNCLDESRYYVEYLKKNPNPHVTFVALAFELDKTQDKAFQKLQRLKKQIGITYPILLAQYGGSNKKEAAKKLPMLNHILSYPTTIFIDKKGKVRKIHTGFNGPATGQKYIDFKKEFEDFVKQLSEE
ncbi:TlpA disulfide reductase family protein [uncultured Tenacibaculum sp.]|uniref:TlpA disulfide reductase family protein n=1 Tax=uncultured Tenacibaculum sp. TaxID=174713 RepID=UPI002627F09D|nr:TlpA disulfide reductase family protein [uncultured Tenacibaculum sp.]